ncbi:MAG TPA: peptidylprolyl isomerase [Burkholderiales bacterium]|jgi:peptidyl-prolyl cis-trans isomerase SurA|nr:peptidylprolyl isomerase [Burkholderiales bacterium]
MHRILLSLLLAVPLLASAQRVNLVDRIVAVVNKEVITYSELSKAMAAAERELRRQGAQAPERSVLERQMLERLILDKAQLQMAKETGIRVDDLQLDRSMQRVAEQNRMTLSEFRKALESDRIPFDAFREDLREQIILTRLREREVDDKIQVSDAEVDQFLKANGGQSGERVEYNVSHILVRVPDQASPDRVEAARQKAEKARAEATASGDFAKIAATYSDAPDALQGGALGWRTQDRVPELFASELLKMKPGEVSEVMRSPAGFHVIKLVDRRGASAAAAPVTQTRLRHILIRTGDTVSEAEARRRLLDLRERIVDGKADFADLARVHSEDATAARGGELDWLYPGETVPEFERAYQELKIGEVSQPVRTPFGYHLIQVLERRSAQMSPDRLRLEARQALRERKSDEAYQEWLRQLRDQTYVEVRLEDR